jgi:hypothetical protein
VVIRRPIMTDIDDFIPSSREIAQAIAWSAVAAAIGFATVSALGLLLYGVAGRSLAALG